jgi:hypothetical protein
VGLEYQICNVYNTSNAQELAAYRDQTYSRMHAQVTGFGDYHSWQPIADDRETLDMREIFTNGGVYRDWEIPDMPGYAARYISVPSSLG